MKIFHFSFRFLLCMSLLVPAAMAETFSVPDKERRQGMSYEEYSSYREKMRKRMEGNKLPAAEQKQPSESSRFAPEKIEKSGSTYGQGYQSRNATDDRPDMAAINRPERPRFERFNRGDMGRR